MSLPKPAKKNSSNMTVQNDSLENSSAMFNINRDTYKYVKFDFRFYNYDYVIIIFIDYANLKFFFTKVCKKGSSNARCAWQFGKVANTLINPLASPLPLPTPPPPPTCNA